MHGKVARTGKEEVGSDRNQLWWWPTYKVTEAAPMLKPNKWQQTHVFQIYGQKAAVHSVIKPKKLIGKWKCHRSSLLWILFYFCANILCFIFLTLAHATFNRTVYVSNIDATEDRVLSHLSLSFTPAKVPHINQAITQRTTTTTTSRIHSIVL